MKIRVVRAIHISPRYHSFWQWWWFLLWGCDIFVGPVPLLKTHLTATAILMAVLR